MSIMVWINIDDAWHDFLKFSLISMAPSDETTHECPFPFPLINFSFTFLNLEPLGIRWYNFSGSKADQ